MRASTLLAFLASLTLTVVGVAFAQETTPSKSAPAKTEALSQRRADLRDSSRTGAICPTSARGRSTVVPSSAASAMLEGRLAQDW
ncbi:hypothetical protein MOX02_59290 [Methylobacterium oxalidis]|uniref:Uncharacterized protein n=1 Tax=Methylobacterium oxalidis TaxID=944322 RepID=A0A512JD78_9HYPH|nr:hypothetical protein MOX02_59290 [Methylobacterium oxalidis]GLS64851.1 hypothetical protein GCM10007888_32320 [Methylobacterium oxalidis]